METYYQESGRAGRDGLPSECILYYRPGDIPRQSSMVFYENSGLQNLYDMVRYCQSRRNCRRNAFFRHFGEPLRDCNGMCDNCAHEPEVNEVDVTPHARIIISILREMQENDQKVTILQMVDKLRVKAKGVAPDLNREDQEQLVVQLIVDRILKEEFQHTAYSTNAYIALGPLWTQVIKGQKTVKLDLLSGHHNKSVKSKTGKRSSVSALDIKLDELRKEISTSQGGMFPHAVLSGQQIKVLSSQRPTSLGQLENLIGKLKTEKYGSRIINLIQQFLDSDLELPNGDMPVESVVGEEKKSKRRKKVTAPVLIESSEDEVQA